MSYSDEQKAVALAALEANGGNIDRTAKFCKIDRRTIRRWASGENINEDVSRNAHEKKEALADRLEALAHRLVDSIDEDKIGDASLQMVATSLGIAVDKMRLLREQPTQITDDTGLTEEKRSERVMALFDAARERRSRAASEGRSDGLSAVSE